jgi:hypothetical protein
MHWNWNAITAISSAVSMIAFIATAVFVAAELKGLEKSRYLQITSELYATWQSREFMDSQLWLMHRLEETTWADFIETHRADFGEQAFHRVGSFYDRVGTLVRNGLINEREILSTIGAYAIAVWHKIEPLVREARQIENSVLFDDFERLLPSCYECYVPNLPSPRRITPFTMPRDGGTTSHAEAPRAGARPAASTQTKRAGPASGRMTVQALRKRLDRGEPITVLDVRQREAMTADPRRLPGAVVMQPDKVAERWSELPQERDVVAYCT